MFNNKQTITFNKLNAYKIAIIAENWTKVQQSEQLSSYLVSSSTMAFIQTNSPTHCMAKGIHALLSLFNLSESCGVIIIWNPEPKEIKIYS